MIKCIGENAFTNALEDMEDGDIENMAKEYTKEDIEGIIKELETDAMDIDLLFDKNSRLADRIYYLENDRDHCLRKREEFEKQIKELQMWMNAIDKRVTAIMHKLNIEF